MYFSIHYYYDNLYLYHKNYNSILIKNNFAYKITENESYNKITSIISHANTRDTLEIFDNNKIKINFNCIALIEKLLKNCELPIKQNILIPNIKNIQLYNQHPDLNSINCLCHDTTYIINLPNITVKIAQNSYYFKNWIGNNQLWLAHDEDIYYHLYAYIYIFSNYAILMVSRTEKNNDSNHLLDLDFSCIYEYSNTIKDEFSRIDCSNMSFDFNNSNITILHSPLNTVSLSTDIEIAHDLLPN
jgi:hypothetical protein